LACNFLKTKENVMRGPDERMGAKLIAVIPEKFVPPDHPLRPIRDMVDKALVELSSDFSKMYSHTGRPGIPPEKLLKALLLQALYSIRSNRLLMEEITYSILFRWFLDLGLDDRVWDHSTFSQNQERLLRSEIAKKFFARIMEQAQAAGLLSDEHFTVDGTLIESWASLKSFRPKDGPPSSSPKGRNEEVDFRMDEDGGGLPEDAIHRSRESGLALPSHCGGVQSGPNEKPWTGYGITTMHRSDRTARSGTKGTTTRSE
jgi:transposase